MRVTYVILNVLEAMLKKRKKEQVKLIYLI